MNESPVRTLKDVLLENEALHEDNETLFKTDEDLILEISNLREELDQVKNENIRQKRMINALKIRQSEKAIESKKMSDEILRLSRELQTIKNMGVWEFANTYCSDEENAEAGSALARSLLGHRMTHEEMAIDKAENAYVPYTGDDF